MTGWKKAPHPTSLASCCDLYLQLLPVAPNGSISPTKLHLALTALHNKSAVNFTGREMVAWSDDMGALIRMGFTKLVESVPEPHRSRVLVKATGNVLDPTHIDITPCVYWFHRRHLPHHKSEHPIGLGPHVGTHSTTRASTQKQE
jgi:hypothetical protein